MTEILERIGNVFGHLLIGALIISFGLSRFQQKKMTARSFWAVFFIVLGAKIALPPVF